MDVVDVRKRKGRMRTNCPFELDEGSNPEIRRIFWTGKMQMLFGLVDSKIIDIEQAADIAEMTLPEAEEMLQGWRVAQER